MGSGALQRVTPVAVAEDQPPPPPSPPPPPPPPLPPPPILTTAVHEMMASPPQLAAAAFGLIVLVRVLGCLCRHRTRVRARGGGGARHMRLPPVAPVPQPSSGVGGGRKWRPHGTKCSPAQRKASSGGVCHGFPSSRQAGTKLASDPRRHQGISRQSSEGDSEEEEDFYCEEQDAERAGQHGAYDDYDNTVEDISEDEDGCDEDEPYDDGPTVIDYDGTPPFPELAPTEVIGPSYRRGAR